MSLDRFILLPLAAAVLQGCGSNVPPPEILPTAEPGTPVSGFVYYDLNRDGQVGGDEAVRFGGVTLSILGRSATSDAAGRFRVEGVPDGVHLLEAQAETLPAYFSPPAGISINAPSSDDVPFPVVLPLGPYSRPHRYLAFGDSITAGDGSSDGSGYADWLRVDLQATFQKGDVIQDGHPGTRSIFGEYALGDRLNHVRPAYVLILYGTNDWNEAECREAPPCYTVDALRSMAGQARSFGAMPIIGTIPPVNPAWEDENPTERNAWVRAMNDRIKAMARTERVAVARVYEDLWSQPSVPAVFDDAKHPNDAGYRIIARSFYNAITQPLQAGWSISSR